MSVIAFTGWPGHGKSYGVVKHVILENLKKGRTVVTNIPMKAVNVFAYLQACEVKPPMNLIQITMREWDEVISGKRDIGEMCPPGSVIVLDEVSRLWSAGMRANEIPDAQKRFLAEHRHRVGPDGHACEIVLVAQDLAQISNFARILIERTVCVFKLKEVGQPDKYRVDIYMGARISGSGGTLVGSSFGKYSSTVWNCYRSHTQSEVIGIEAEADKRGSIWSRGIVVVGLPLGILAVVLGVIFVFSNLADLTSVEQATASESIQFSSVPVFPAKQSEAIVISQDEPSLKESSRWYVTGSVVDSEGSGLVVLSDSAKTRYVDAKKYCVLAFPDLLEYECVVGNERVTSWTGGRNNSKPIFSSSLIAE